VSGALTSRHYYAPSRSSELANVLEWVDSIPNLLVTIHSLNLNQVKSANWSELVDSARLDFLRAMLAVKLQVPQPFVDNEAMPRVLGQLVDSFDARICNMEYPEMGVRNGCKALLHLSRTGQSVPDIFDKDWQRSVWGKFELDEQTFEFLERRSVEDVFIASIATPFHWNRDAFGSLKPHAHGRSYDTDEDMTGRFQMNFENAVWKQLWTKRATAPATRPKLSLPPRQ
jgi:hypothetical protein